MQTTPNNIPASMSAVYNMPVGMPGMQPQAVSGGMPNYQTLPPDMAIGMTNMAHAYCNIVPEERAVLVNAKQYNRIIKRRETRRKQLGGETLSITQSKARRAYLHESRHKHAKNRQRGEGGRFLSKAERDALRSKDGEDKE